MIMKKTMICFIDPDNHALVSERLTHHVSQGVQVLFVNGECAPHHIPYIVTENIQDSAVFFVTDNKRLACIVSKIYARFFCGCYYFQGETATAFIEEDAVYQALCEAYESEAPAWVPDDLPQMQQDKDDTRKLFYFNEEYYLFEPYGNDIKVIHLSGSEDTPLPLKAENLIVCGTVEKSVADSLFEVIEFVLGQDGQFYKTKYGNYQSHYATIRQILRQCEDSILRASAFDRQLYEAVMNLAGVIYGDYAAMFMLSFQLQMAQSNAEKGAVLDAIARKAAYSSALTPFEKFYVSYQISGSLFGSAELPFNESAALGAIRNELFTYLTGMLAEQLHFIEKKDRNAQLILFITDQFLSLLHGPTKTALDRAFIVQELGYETMIINTKSLYSPSGAIPFVASRLGNVKEELNGCSQVPFNGRNIPLMQISSDMPTVDGIEEILRYVNNTKPFLIVSIGNSFVGELCAGIVPVIAVSTVPSGFSLSRAQFYASGKRMSEHEKKLVLETKGTLEAVIETPFSFGLRPRTDHFTKAALGLPEDKFLLLVVGGRLDNEVTDAFVEMFLSTAENDTYMVFIGNFDKYEHFCEKYPLFKTRSAFLGMVQDALAVNEVCDLYVNPLRIGGGTSAVEAMHMGLPCVSIKSGDVSYNIGEEFCVKNYAQMAEAIKTYATDKTFYASMRAKAKQRGDFLLDSKRLFKEILDQAMGSRLFK